VNIKVHISKLIGSAKQQPGDQQPSNTETISAKHEPSTPPTIINGIEESINQKNHAHVEAP